MLAAEPTASFNITQLITQLVGTFATAFLGVMSAFLLEGHKRRRQLNDREKEIAEAKEDRRFEALLGAQGVLIAQANSLAAFLAQYPPDTNPFDNLKHIYIGFSKQSLDFSGLSFLGSSQNPQLIIDLDVADATYRMAVATAAQRNALLDDFLGHKETEILMFDEKTGGVKAMGNKIMMRNLREVSAYCLHAMKRARDVNMETANKLLEFANTAFSKEKQFPSIRAEKTH